MVVDGSVGIGPCLVRECKPFGLFWVFPCYICAWTEFVHLSWDGISYEKRLKMSVELRVFDRPERQLCG